MEKYNASKSFKFKHLNQMVLPNLRSLLLTWLPDGHFESNEFIALNPTRMDRHKGSFRINTETGKWSDFSTRDRGGDVISFYAYINHLTQGQAAKQLSNLLGMKGFFDD